MNVLRKRSWSPWVVGAAIGVLSWFAFATAFVYENVGYLFAVGVAAAIFGTSLERRVVVDRRDLRRGCDAIADAQVTGSHASLLPAAT